MTKKDTTTTDNTGQLVFTAIVNDTKPKSMQGKRSTERNLTTEEQGIFEAWQGKSLLEVLGIIAHEDSLEHIDIESLKLVDYINPKGQKQKFYKVFDSGQFPVELPLNATNGKSGRVCINGRMATVKTRLSLMFYFDDMQG